MIYDKEGDINFDAWIGYNRDFLPSEVKNYFEEQKDIIRMIFTVRPKIKKHLTPALRNLMFRQYPVLQSETRPIVVEFINEIVEITASELYLRKMFDLVHGHNTGVNVREEFPEIDSWTEYYEHPRKPDFVDEKFRNEYWWISDIEWKTEVKEEEKKRLQFKQWEETRKKEFIILVQNMFFKYYKELLDLNSDEWSLYALIIREEYDNFKTYCEHIEEFIDCSFPEEDMKLSDIEYFDKFSHLPTSVKQKIEDIRIRRISGERI